ncbi:MAG: NAD(P)H-dependent oxidoreductase subunit E [Candidatus Planktophila sp.]|jgi:formate dehydrogenase subunit gamma|nr:NAD(P)H-dependent oxidoreductase subunit E [Candidatus Planktophila sp.]
MSYPSWSIEEATRVLSPLKDVQGPVLIALQAVQERFGYVHEDAVGLIAETFNVSRADVHGVLTYYHDLRTTPAPARSIHICVAEACQAVGSRELVAAVEKKLGKKIDETHADVEIKSAYCFGNCALSPAAMVDGQLVGRATVEKVTA